MKFKNYILVTTDLVIFVWFLNKDCDLQIFKLSLLDKKPIRNGWFTIVQRTSKNLMTSLFNDGHFPNL